MIFNVKLAERFDATGRNGFGDTVEPITTVVADYFRIEGGALIFRNTAGRNSFPHPVHIFAAGVWTEVEVESTS